jgi:DivIVA domain-containing protein
VTGRRQPVHADSTQAWHDRVVVVLWILVIAAIVFGVAVLALGRGDALAPAPADRVEPQLPDRPLRPHDIDELRLPQGLRGYRMSEVDAVLVRLRDELVARDAELAQWRAGQSTPAEGSDDAAEHPTPERLAPATELPADPGA